MSETNEEADVAVQQLRECIDHDTELITAAHSISDKLLYYDFIYEHLFGNLPEGLENLIQDLLEKIMEFREWLETETEVHIAFIEGLDGKPMGILIGNIEEQEEADAKLIREVHSNFVELVRLIEESEHVAIEKGEALGKHRLSHTGEAGEIEELVKYLEEFYKFVKFYDTALNKILQKLN